MALTPVPELIKEAKTFPLLYGLYEQLITEPIRFDSAQEAQAHSYSYGIRIDLSGRAGVQTWTITPPNDYHYFLEGIRVFYPEDTVNANTLSIEVEQPERGRLVTLAQIAIPVLTTPGELRPKKYMVRLNTLFGPTMNCVIKIRGQDGTRPAYVDLMSEGLLIPAAGLKPKGLEPWQ